MTPPCGAPAPISYRPLSARLIADAPAGGDFHARLPRRALSIAARRAHIIRREAGMRLAALCVTAAIVMASWQVQANQQAGGTTAAAVPDDQIRAMPFETPGDSFPGSAYYYLARDADRLAPGIHGDGEADAPADRLGEMPAAGPAARAIIAHGGADYVRALDCLTAAVYYEAASEPDDGQRAVAQVVLNRLAHPSFPKTVCGVVYQGSERPGGCQFTFACDGAILRQRSHYFWDRAQQVARAALAGYVFTPVGLATHYHTFAVHPYWDGAMNFIGQIGAHRFYRFPGVAGLPAAFRFAWSGGEPLPGPHPKLALAGAAPADATDPLALERAYEARLKQAGGQPAMVQPITESPAAPPLPAYTGGVMRQGGDAAYRASGLPSGDAVHSAYQDSGRWIATPQ